MAPRPGESGGARVGGTYPAWAASHAASAGDRNAQRRHAARLGPVIRIAVVVDATAASARPDGTVASVVAQSWPHWRCAVVGGAVAATTDERVVALSPRPSARDAAHAFLEASDEDMVVLLRAGDLLEPDCLYHAAVASWRDPLTSIVYWDDDVLDASGTPQSPLFKPSWSPDLLLSLDYIGRSAAIRRTFMLANRGPAFDDVGMWELHLAAARELEDAQVARVQRVLTHMPHRSSREVTAAAAAMIDRHVKRLDLGAFAAIENGRSRVRWSISDPAPQVTIVMCTRHNRPMLELSLGTLHTTDYAPYDVVVVDNGDWTGIDARAWYAERFPDLDITLVRYDEPIFNWGTANNLGASVAKGEILVFLNDDTQITSPDWLRELVGWLSRPEVGVTGLQLLDGDGRIQHAGVVLGLGGFAGHVFGGADPDADSPYGPVRAYRDMLAVTGACLAIRRDLFTELGTFDVALILCASDVALGIAAVREGYRVVCSPFATIRHLESATRESHVPPSDFDVSYWQYQPFLHGGDPYFSDNLSMLSMFPAPRERGEPTALDLVGPTLGRTFATFRQRSDAREAEHWARSCRATADDRRLLDLAHARHPGRGDVRTITWFFPEIDSPFYGGIHTALRIADHLAADHDVENQFAVWGTGPEPFVKSAINAAFPRLVRSRIQCYDGDVGALTLPPSDAAIATWWPTAYKVVEWPLAARKFYLIQDFEPMFHPAGTMYALAEESYRLGLYGICNTSTLAAVYRGDYGGLATSFQPAVDRALFHPGAQDERAPDEPVTVFAYSRPGHWRNCWELASLALTEVKGRLGRDVRVIAAGSWALDSGLDAAASIRALGLLDYRATGRLYRQCDIGLCLTVSRHPSYLPLELMASGAPVVAFDNPNCHWLLRHEDNALLAPQTVAGVADALERLAVDRVLRRHLRRSALDDIDANYSDWAAALSGIHSFLCDPEGAPEAAPPLEQPRDEAMVDLARGDGLSKHGT